MRELSWLVPLAAGLAGLWLLRLFLVTRAILGLRFRPSSYEMLAPEQIPSHHVEAAAAIAAELVQLGFALRQAWWLTPATGSEQRVLVQEYAHSSLPISVQIHPHERFDFAGRMRFSFETSLVDGRQLLSVSDPVEQLIPLPASLQLEHVAGDVGTVYQRHLERVGAAQASGVAAQALSSAEVVSTDRRLSQEMLAQLQRSGHLAEAGDGLAIRLWPAVRAAFGALRAASQFKRTQKKNPLVAVHPVALSEYSQQSMDLEYFQRFLATGRQIPSAAKWVLTIVSLAAFWAGLGWIMSFSSASVLVLALVVHEYGHLAAMRWFGYRDTQLVFLPFLGGAAIAHDRLTLAPWKQLVILFMGPLPGIFAATGVLVWGDASPALHEAGMLVLIFNVFNLLPILPLDGGQIMDVSVFGRFPRARVVFLAASGALMIAMGLMIPSSLIIAVIGVLLLLQVPGALRTARVVRELRKGQTASDADESALPRTLLTRVRKPDWARVAPTARLVKVRELLQVLRRPLPGWGAVAVAVAGYLSPLVVALGLLFARELSAEGANPYPQNTGAETGPAQAAEPVATVDDAENAAPLLAAASLVLRSEAGQRQGGVRDVINLLHEAAQRPRLVLSPAKQDSSNAFDGTTLVFELLDHAEEELRLRNIERSLTACLDCLKLLRLSEQTPGWLKASGYQGATERAWTTIEELLFVGPQQPREVITELAGYCDEGRYLEYMRRSLPLERLTLAAYMRGRFTGATQVQRPSFLTRVFLRASSRSREKTADHFGTSAAALEAMVEKIQTQGWIQTPDAAAPFNLQPEYRQLQSAIAHLRVARSGLAFLWQESESAFTETSLSSVNAPWWSGAPVFPGTAEPLALVDAGGCYALQFRTTAQTIAEPADEDEYPIGFPSRSWRLKRMNIRP